jgi:predicted GH43/DUF377 family glycosyl hydrolase
MSSLSRRSLVAAGAGTLAAGALAGRGWAEPPAASPFTPAEIAPFATPYKLDRLILQGTHRPGDFDEKSVDCPFVFSADGMFYMTYVGFDGTGYQTGLARSHDLVRWERVRLILPRDPGSPYTRFNVAMMCILRDPALGSAAPLIKVGGKYLGAWHAYPSAGYEVGPAVIGLAWSDNLLDWKVEAPILTPDPNAAWEAGGLYKPYLVKEGDTYFLFYNAKTTGKPWIEQTGLATSTDLKSWTRYAGNPILTAGPPGSVDDRFASDPCVVKHKGLWAMYYYGLARKDGKARELLALGHDPRHFTKTGEILVDVGGPGSIDDDYAHKPSVITVGGDLHHFYCAVSGKWPNDTRGISVARSRAW